ncbi:hypothetical protein KY289_018317 [Solanum tuberosum]|nr:hypothetical protein KY289_018317 [Solanum tuberosum]
MIFERLRTERTRTARVGVPGRFAAGVGSRFLRWVRWKFWFSILLLAEEEERVTKGWGRLVCAVCMMLLLEWVSSGVGLAKLNWVAAKNWESEIKEFGFKKITKNVVDLN